MRLRHRIKQFINEKPFLSDQFFPSLKPSAICLGAQKSGTTALFEYLSSHPNVVPPRLKEIDFFNCNARYGRGIGFYHSHFRRRTYFNNRKITFDITPGYLVGDEITASRIHDYNPEIRLIVLLRNPITRAHAAWNMYRKLFASNSDWFFKWVQRCDCSIPRSFFVRRQVDFGKNFRKDIVNEMDAMNIGRLIEMPILLLGMYHQQLRNYFDYFRRDQILTIASEELKAKTAHQMRIIEDFIGLEPHIWSPKELEPRFVGVYEDDISQGAYDLLRSFYDEQNSALFSLLQKDFAWD